MTTLKELKEEIDLINAKIDILADGISQLNDRTENKEAEPQEEKITMLDGGLK